MNAVAAVDLNLAFIVLPGYAEHDDAFGFNDAFQQTLLGVFRIFCQKRVKAHEDFFNSLMERFLIGVALFEVGKQGVQVSHFDAPLGLYCTNGKTNL